MALSGLSGLSGLFGGGYNYLAGSFRFTTNQAAPLPSPYTEAGAIGSLTVVDTGNKLSASGGALLLGTTTGVGDPGVWSPPMARIVGRTLLVHHTAVTNALRRLGFDTDQTGDIRSSIYFAGTTEIRVYDFNQQIANVGTYAAAQYDVMIVLRAVGSFVFIKGGAFAAWTLLWVGILDIGATVSAAMIAHTTGGLTGSSLDDFRVLDLATYDGRFAADEGYATGRRATTSAGDTIAMTADAWVEHTLTAATGVDKDFYVRWTDDNNCWIVRHKQAGSTVKLIEKVAGVETSRLSTAQTYTNGTAYRQIAICEGTTITVFVNTTRAGAYASATTNQTATTAKAPVAGSEMKSYPRTTTFPSGI
jgi:hypothetical protein